MGVGSCAVVLILSGSCIGTSLGCEGVRVVHVCVGGYMYEVGSRCALCRMYVCLCLVFATVCISITYTVSLVGGMKKRMSQPGRSSLIYVSFVESFTLSDPVNDVHLIPLCMHTYTHIH